MKKPIKIAVIAITAVAVLGIALKILERNSGPVPLNSLERSMTAPKSAGLPGGIAGKVMNAPAATGGKVSSNIVAQDSVGSYSAAESAAGDVTDKKVMKDGHIEMRVDSATKAADKIGEIAKSNGGDVFSSDFYQNGDNFKNGNITVKVPVANFEKTFSDLKKVAALVIRETTSGTDVTMQYADLQSQLKNYQAEEESYIRLLGQAQKMDDILSITQQLSRVRGQIESTQGRIRYMDSQTDMASISINLTEDTNVTVADSWRPWQVVKESVNALIRNIQEWVNFIIRLIIEVLPVLILYGIVLFVLYKIGRVIYRRYNRKGPGEEIK